MILPLLTFQLQGLCREVIMSVRLKSALLDPANSVDGIKSGDNTNNVSINKTQGVRLNGTATVWKDMIMGLFGKRLASTAGKVDYDYDENAIKFQPSGVITTTNDRVGGNQEINHEFKVGTSITFSPHIHWWQQVTSNAVLPIVFTMRWRLQLNGSAKATSWTSITADAGAGGDDQTDFTSESDGLYNQITVFDDIVITCDISDTIQIQMTRTDAQAGNVMAYFLDLHGEVDSKGSDSEWAKT